ncbi:ParB/RepB/Spo0J family partition protein [Paenibacillus sacheonensis]|uniref:ParB/RepB/Spo0J family partition protein n=1 Tax=Paenibacillus sacheonensis TaxID=742054 RepID=A0A7X4YPP8_9BACL|nr:ParB/RepB/Spo0J family partition protein [Paenibacillus sacheonensis]MBM7564984.1 ParB family chromosome partitioning protein [Paenibacillus sacheonensis]NBC70228.1 ParB/RepB/Spo0J family partition protein [Paenibacillus sacheonensis]
MDIIHIDLHLIDEDTDQPRYQFDQEALEELMKSIEELGLLSPIKVRTTPDGRYKIIYGNRRYKASKMLGKPTIPCIVSTATDEMDIYLEQIAENLTREGFSPIEEAEAFHKLMNESKFNSSLKFLASKLGKPEAYIKNKCELLKFGNAVRKLIVGGTQIRKDKLTEDQLLPIKDLPIEHRDPLALIVARDEMPVSDVKKIAKLFKDKEISDGTKDKLLYKNGFELLQTWSTVQQNKKERERAAELKAEQAERAAEAKAEKARLAAEAAASADMAGTGAVGASANGASGGAGNVGAAGGSNAAVAGGSASGAIGAGDVGALGGAAAGGGAPGLGGSSSDAADAAARDASAGSTALAEAAAAALGLSAAEMASTEPLAAGLQQLLATLAAVQPLPPEALAAYEAAQVQGTGSAGFAAGVDALIYGLEQQLAQWREVKAVTDAKLNA